MHLLDPTVRRMTDKALLETMDSCLILSRIAAVNLAFQNVEAWIDGLGDHCSEELDQRNRAKAYQAEQLTKAKLAQERKPVRRDALTAAFFGGIGGVAPDAERREGYPTDQPNSPETCNLLEATRRNPTDQISRGQGRGVQTVPPAS